MPNVTRIAVFYDGNFFVRVSQYFAYEHRRCSYLNLLGFHEFIRKRVAESEHTDVAFCQIVERHWFQGRFSLAFTREADPARAISRLEKDRLQDERFATAGVVTHYYPMNEKDKGPPREKGIDVSLSLEAYELAVHKRFEIMVLVTGDEDYVPLVRKTIGCGARAMLIGMEAKWTDNRGSQWINTSQALLDEVSYPILLNQEIDSRTGNRDPYIDALFRPTRPVAAA